MLKLAEIFPSPENDQLYRPIDPTDPEIIALSKSIVEIGLQESIVVSADGYILSGHRRYAAAKLAGLDELPCIVRDDVRHDEDPDQFLKLLREFNRQRVKSFDERWREEVLNVATEDAYEHLTEYRQRDRAMTRFSAGSIVKLGKKRDRAKISVAKAPMLAAVKKIVAAEHRNWPLSDRQIHYRLLNDAPLIHASKPDSLYKNDLRSYKRLTDLLTRARLEGEVPWEAIGDETRPFTKWHTWREVGQFIRSETDGFLRGYWRDLLQSQPAHIEIVAEKLTVRGIIERVAEVFTIPVTIGRGYCSLDPRRDLSQRFQQSGKDRLIILMLSDFDPEGESITESYARSLRDDFEIDEDRICAIKVALTMEQVKRFKLPKAMKAKKTSSRFKSFKKKHGENVWELEALESDVLANELHRAIEKTLDMDVFELERKQEAEDARQLEGRRRALLRIGEDQQ